MKRLILVLILFLCVFTTVVFAQNRQSAFSKALRTCEKFEQKGSVSAKGEVFDIQVNLNKSKNMCVYKEKIYQGNRYELLTCNFDNSALPFMADSMEKFYEAFPAEFQKNRIFEAKMTTNGEIFTKYLANPKYCKITYSNK